MSLGRSRGCSRALVIWPAHPFWNSRTDAPQRIGAPSTSNRGLHMRCVIRTSARCCFSRHFTDWDLLLLASGTIFYCLVPFWGPTSPSSSTSTGLFFFRSGLAFNPRSRGICGGGGGVTWDIGVVFYVDSLPLAAWDPLSSCCPCLTPYCLPLRLNRLGMQVPSMDYEHRSFYLIHPRRSKCKSEAFSDFALPRSETCLSPHLAIDEIRPPPLQVLLQQSEELAKVGAQLEGDFVKLVVELEEDPSEPKIQALKRQSGPVLDS